MISHIVMPSTFPVTCHTDFVGINSTFVAVEGYADNGVNYIKKAVEKGARTIIIRQDTVLDEALSAYLCENDIVVERVANTRKALAELSAKAAGFPARKLQIIGITGTKGKTTTSFLLEHILRTAGYKTALISSAQNRIQDFTCVAPLTTPQPDYLQQFLKLSADNNVDYVVMEVAAQALTLYRVEGIEFCGIIFTNFSHEHLEFYATLEDYFSAKCLIFDMAKRNAPILINHDDVRGAQLCLQNLCVKSYGFAASQSDYIGSYVSNPVVEISINVQHRSNKNLFNCSKLFGVYNAYNILAAASMALECNVSPVIIDLALSTFAGVPGRLQEHHLPNGARCFIDYAHNPESFRAVLSTLRALTHHLIVVFGAGGGKDKLKRPIMGRITAEIADVVVVTSDNPRLEDKVIICDDIIRGIPMELHYKVVREFDRKKAIESAYFLSENGSIIALLGKGPDEYQIIGTTKYYFSERNIVEQL